MTDGYDIEKLDRLLKQVHASETPDSAYAELLELIHSYGQDEISGLIEASLERNGLVKPPVREETNEYWKNIAQFVLSADKEAPAPKVSPVKTTPARRLHSWQRGWFRYAAAVILLLAGAGAYFHFHQPAQPAIAGSGSGAKPVILPGGNRAILTLGDGSTIVLDSAANGRLAQQAGSDVIKKSDGQLTYETGSRMNGAHSPVTYNTMRTPMGGQYQLVLPDGTKVWLNAASSISYPTVFNGKERPVTMTGEAYFEVAQNSRQPFMVNFPAMTRREGEGGKWMTVEVLGTHFNINNYDDEGDVRTTLLEGSVKVAVGNKTVLLHPGQQTATKFGQEHIDVKDDVNTDAVVAWKNGIFHFNHASLRQVMRQLSRWYDIEVVYQGDIAPVEFEGKIERGLNLADVLDGLKKTGVHFNIEGRKLFVMP